MNSGLLVLDKPPGLTSHDVVARARRLLGERRIGHTGTLDPLATGVLPLVVGRATRLASFFAASDKEYVATVRFGRATPTYDADPRFLEPGDPIPPPEGLTAEAVERALEPFRGTYRQRPPAFSAKKQAGVAAHRLARRNLEVELEPVEVTAHEVTLVEYRDGGAILRLVCSAGFYVRTLAHDLGQTLGCGGYVEALRRTRVGEVTLAQAMTLAELEGSDRSQRVVVPIERLLTRLPAVRLTAAGAASARHGRVLGPGDAVAGGWPFEAAAVGGETGRVRLFDPDGALLGLAEVTPGGLLHASLVLV